VVSQEIRFEADKTLSSESLFQQPEIHKGKMVILGGTIVGSSNSPEGTYVEIIEKPLDYRGRPKYTDQSTGRFLVFHEGYLDAAIYVKGRHITVAGEVIGKKVRPLGEITYRYPLIKSREIHLVQPGQGIPIHFGIGIWQSF
jgi:outer membrane lipoprotein